MKINRYIIWFWGLLFCSTGQIAWTQNPILPPSAFIPDGEPRIFEYEGEKRVFLYGSKDEKITCTTFR
jgi:hypothetical protein